MTRMYVVAAAARINLSPACCSHVHQGVQLPPELFQLHSTEFGQPIDPHYVTVYASRQGERPAAPPLFPPSPALDPSVLPNAFDLRNKRGLTLIRLLIKRILGRRDNNGENTARTGYFGENAKSF